MKCFPLGLCGPWITFQIGEKHFIDDSARLQWSYLVLRPTRSPVLTEMSSSLSGVVYTG